MDKQYANYSLLMTFKCGFYVRRWSIANLMHIVLLHFPTITGHDWSGGPLNAYVESGTVVSPEFEHITY